MAGAVFDWGEIWLTLQPQFITARNEDYLGFHERYEGKIQAAFEKTIETMEQFD